MNKTGKFVISLDFELMWGVRDIHTKESYGENILGVWKILPKKLEMFNRYDVKATFAVVGFLMAKNRNELLKYSPKNRPKYKEKTHCPYVEIDLLGGRKSDEGYLFAPELVDMISKYPQHELATHTFSHFYPLERGAGIDEFKDDLKAAKDIAIAKGISFDSIVFPRNQFGKEHLVVLKELQISSYRGNENVWFRGEIRVDEDTISNKIFRWLDAHVNLFGHHSYSLNDIKKNNPINIPSSRFLRPYSFNKPLEYMKLRRVLKSMSYAARNNKVYHLWWHPHNFGVNQEENLKMLDKILNHYKKLNIKYGFKSVTMNEISTFIQKMNNKI